MLGYNTVPKRIIARLDIKNGRVVKRVMMEGVQDVGDPIELCQQYFNQGVDEILLLDTVASLYQRLELPDIISELVKDIFVPVCAGGGINSCQGAESLFLAGADKICINTSALENPRLLVELSKEFGAQSIVVQVDVRCIKGRWRIFFNSGRDMSKLELPVWLEVIQEAGIGEVLITSIEKDGTGRGPDYPLIEIVKEYINAPIIYGGGISTTQHIYSVLKNKKINAISLASFLHIDNADISDIKSDLKNMGIVIRDEIEQ
jgi:imidazoleglycerol phosphate synthase cyclase subunit